MSTNLSTNRTLAELRQMLAETERAAGASAEAAKVLRRLVANRERLADQAAREGVDDG